jgi:hypothetical protein
MVITGLVSGLVTGGSNLQKTMFLIIQLPQKLKFAYGKDSKIN